MARQTEPGASPTVSRVAWTRGQACLPLAEILGDGPAIPLSGDIANSCVADNVDILVSRRLTRIDVVPTVVPHDVDLDTVTTITAAIGDGPHSSLAAVIAARLADRLQVPGELATVFRTEEEAGPATRKLDRLAVDHPNLQRRALQAVDAKGLVATLSATTLLIVGAPGGSWFQRQIFGPGHRLLVAAPGGAVVVRSAPRRCYHEATNPGGVAVSPHLAAADAQALVSYEAVPVADAGKLVGIVRAAALRENAGDSVVADLMEAPVAVSATEPADAAADLEEFFGNSPIPVIDSSGHLLGVIRQGSAKMG